MTHFITFSFHFTWAYVQSMFDNIYVLLIFCQFCYMNELIVKNCLFDAKIHVTKKDWFYWDRNLYRRVFGIADYESVLSLPRFNMADPIWRTDSWKIFWFRWKLTSHGFLDCWLRICPQIFKNQVGGTNIKDFFSKINMFRISGFITLTFNNNIFLRLYFLI